MRIIDSLSGSVVLQRKRAAERRAAAELQIFLLAM